MLLTDFDYHLPDNLIAQTPVEPRDSSKLLCLNRHTGQIDDKIFVDIADMLTSNDVLVVNETRVINARLKWRIIWMDKECEIFLHKQITDNSWDCLVYPGKKLKPWAQVIFAAPFSSGRERIQDWVVTWEEKVLSATITSISNKWRIVEFSHGGQDFLDIIDKIWEVPLPPYIKNKDSDAERYQTVYNNNDKSWSVAAPTAGLHFTPELMEKLQHTWIIIEKVCLHVWLGTFMNVEVENIQDHDMHSEQIYISPEVSGRLNEYKSHGKRIIATGTTSVRTLESMTDLNGHLGHGQKDTTIFIYPWYEWRFVDSIITNFHLPKSTLLMLVSSFAWDENRKKAYKHAVDSQYRFFSFGDAMWIY
jgi:S-adenosylmethionine:tRNA ribosyltransferase-isomerase